MALQRGEGREETVGTEEKGSRARRNAGRRRSPERRAAPSLAERLERTPLLYQPCGTARERTPSPCSAERSAERRVVTVEGRVCIGTTTPSGVGGVTW